MIVAVVDDEWSPRTRGWSLVELDDREDDEVVPAHAGVVPAAAA